MKQRRASGAKVFVSMNSDGQVVITPADEFLKSLDSLGIDSDQLPATHQNAAELDSAGRLSLPSDVAAFLRGANPRGEST